MLVDVIRPEIELDEKKLEAQQKLLEKWVKVLEKITISEHRLPIID